MTIKNPKNINIIFFHIENIIIKATAKNVENRYKIDNKEIDIYIPELKFGIEYDGIYFHNSKKSLDKEKRKNVFFNNKGIFVI